MTKSTQLFMAVVLVITVLFLTVQTYRIEQLEIDNQALGQENFQLRMDLSQARSISEYNAINFRAQKWNAERAQEKISELWDRLALAKGEFVVPAIPIWDLSW